MYLFILVFFYHRNHLLINFPKTNSLWSILLLLILKLFYFVHLQLEAEELEEYLAKKQKRGKQMDEKPVEERTVLHSKFLLCIL